MGEVADAPARCVRRRLLRVNIDWCGRRAITPVIGFWRVMVAPVFFPQNAGYFERRFYDVP